LQSPQAQSQQPEDGQELWVLATPRDSSLLTLRLVSAFKVAVFAVFAVLAVLVVLCDARRPTGKGGFASDASDDSSPSAADAIAPNSVNAMSVVIVVLTVTPVLPWIPWIPIERNAPCAPTVRIVRNPPRLSDRREMHGTLHVPKKPAVKKSDLANRAKFAGGNIVRNR
jgi:hypothetical protein